MEREVAAGEGAGTDINVVIMEWRSAIQPAKDWVAYEKAKREELARLAFPNPIKGTNRYNLPDGYKIKLTHKFSYTLGDKDLVDPVLNEKVPVDTQVEAILEAISALGNEGPMLANRLVKWRPELSESEYNKLRDEFPVEAEAKKLIDSILTVKPAFPTMEIEEPKP